MHILTIESFKPTKYRNIPWFGFRLMKYMIGFLKFISNQFHNCSNQFSTNRVVQWIFLAEY